MKPSSTSQPAPPVAKTVPHRTTVHGTVLSDPYYWLRDRNDPEVLAYLEAENRYTQSEMSDTEDLQRTLFDEMVARIQETDLSVPYRLGDFYYYTRTEEGKQYWSLRRKRGSLDAEEEVLLDVDALAEGRDYYRIGSLAISEDHRLLAYGFDLDGSERYTIRIKDLGSGELLADRIPGAATGLEWGNDHRTLFYTVKNEAHRPDRLLRHRLGQDPREDRVLLEEPDERFFLGLAKTRSRKLLLAEMGSSITSEVHLIDADRPLEPPRLFLERRQGIEYDVEHHGEHLYVRTNDGAKNFRLLRAPLDGGDPAAWEEILPASDERKICAVDLFADHLVVHERSGGLQRIRVRRLETGDEHFVAFDEPVYALSGAENAEFDTRTLRFNYGSLTVPRSVYDYEMDTRERTLLKREEVLGGYDPELYASERIFATAQDGTRIPISLVHRKDLAAPGPRPCWLTGYGAYGVSSDPHFSHSRLSLLDRGLVFAIAHVRGGGEMGEPWHDGGKLGNKRNTFTDFNDAAEHLITSGRTAPDRLVASGGSAGGLLMGAVLNLRPELYRAVIADVPFVDVLNTMLDASIPLTVTEYEEWGNPNEEEAFRYMLSYSPYDNVEARDYPHLLVLAGLNDPRVQYWEPAKWVAKLRRVWKQGRFLLLKTNMGAGHGGASGRYDSLREVAFRYAFAFKALEAER